MDIVAVLNPMLHVTAYIYLIFIDVDTLSANVSYFIPRYLVIVPHLPLIFWAPSLVAIKTLLLWYWYCS